MDSVAAERAELERALAEVSSELSDVYERLRDGVFLQRAKPALIEEQRRLREQLEERRNRIQENLANVAQRQAGGLPSPQVGTWSPLPLYPSAAQSEDDDVTEEPRLPPLVPNTNDRVITEAALSVPPSAPQANPQRAFGHLAREVCEILMMAASEKNKIRRLRRCVEEVGDDVPSLRLIAAALSGFRRDGLRNQVRLRIAQLRGDSKRAALTDDLLPLPVETVPLAPIPAADQLPDPRDGLSRIERIVLSAMWALSFRAQEVSQRTARLFEELRLGEAGISAGDVEATLTRLTQPWSRLNPLVDVFGASCRLTSLGEELFCEIEEADDLEPGFTFKVPRVLPVRLPLLLAKGTDGMPPHHLGELIGMALHVLQFGRVDGLESFFSGPDFPSGGVFPYLPRQLYETGTGQVVVRGRMSWEQDEASSRARLIITELPPPVTANDALPQLAKLPGVVNALQESHDGTERVVVELAHVAHAWGLRALVADGGIIGRGFEAELRVNDDGHAMVADLEFVMERFLGQRRDAMRRRVTASLRKLEARAHLIEGLLVAAESLEALLSVLREASDASEEIWALKHLASPELKTQPAFAKQTPLSPETLRDRALAWLEKVTPDEPRFHAKPHSYAPGFSELQARAIVNTRRLASIDREALLRELRALASELADLRDTLKDRAEIDALVRRQLVELRGQFWAQRRTKGATRND